MKCIIIDDDELTLMEIESMVKKTSFLKLLKTCTDPLEAFDLIIREKPDLIFLDVMMPQMSGLDLMKALHKNKPQVILMTLNKEYAVDAFDYNVTDFLTKPVAEERFRKAVFKARNRHESESNSQQADDYIFTKIKSQLVKIKTDDILYLEASGDYLLVKTPLQQYTVHSTLKSVLDKLSARNFMRIHNSYAVRLDKIERIEDNLICIAQKLIPVSRNYKDELLQRLNLI